MPPSQNLNDLSSGLYAKKAVEVAKKEKQLSQKIQQAVELPAQKLLEMACTRTMKGITVPFTVNDKTSVSATSKEETSNTEMDSGSATDPRIYR